MLALFLTTKWYELMKTKERQLANKIAAYWYDKLHMQYAPIFQKQKLADFVESELKTFGNNNQNK